MPCDDYSRTEEGPPCPYEVCKCHHQRRFHKTEGCLACTGDGLDLPARHQFTGPDGPEKPDPRYVCCGRTEGEGCGCPPEPPMTPEEEEELGHQCGNCDGYDPSTCPFNRPSEEEEQAPPDEPSPDHVCETYYCPTAGEVESACHGGFDACCSAPEKHVSVDQGPPPPQPEGRPPLIVAYSVNGHLYEVAVSGDATVRAEDGALIVQHRLGPVAGIVHVAPLITEESARGAEADQ